MLRYMRENVKWIMITVIALFVVSCFAGYGLYARSGNNRQNGEGMKDYPVARVEGKEVMRSEIENGLSRVAERYNQQQITSEDMPQLRRIVLDGIIMQTEMAREIKDKDIKVTKDDINAAYVKIMDGYPTREEFQVYMQRTGLTEKQVKDDLEKQLQQQKLMESISEGVTVTDKDARAFYDSAKNIIYKQPAGVKVNIATFSNPAAAGLAQKAIAGGANWDKIMDEQKAAVVSATSYDKPMLMTNQMMAGPLEVLKDYPMNKLTPVINITSNDACIVIKRTKEGERVLSYNEVSVDVNAALKNQMLQQKQNEYLEGLTKKAKVEILDATIFPPEAKAEDAATEKSGDKAQ